MCYLLIDIRVLHSPVVLGEFNRKDDAGDEEDDAPAQTEPEGILKRETMGEHYAELIKTSPYWSRLQQQHLILTRDSTMFEQRIASTESTAPATGPQRATCSVI